MDDVKQTRALRLMRLPTLLIAVALVISQPARAASRDADVMAAVFVIFYFRWSMHSALAQYVLAKSGGGWKVNCSQLRFYP